MNSKMRERVIFLDRDGTINEEVNYLHRPEDLTILDGVPEAVRLLNDHGYRVVVVTNQAGVARGYYTEADVEKLHTCLNQVLREQGGGEINQFYYCPHHPEHGIGAYKKQCHCRKPATGMFEMAEQAGPVDKAHSWMIGDKLTDIQAGQNYGIKTVLVGTGYGTGVHQEQVKKGDQPYDIFAQTLVDAARIIVAGDEVSEEPEVWSEGCWQ